jgi:hypothetical protein
MNTERALAGRRLLYEILPAEIKKISLLVFWMMINV